MASPTLIDELADHVEALIDSGGVFNLRLEPGEAPDKRALIIDIHAEVLKELRRRGYHDIRATVTRIKEGEEDPDGVLLVPGDYLAIGFAPEEHT
jgi:hypothetical protein